MQECEGVLFPDGDRRRELRRWHGWESWDEESCSRRGATAASATQETSALPKSTLQINYPQFPLIKCSFSNSLTHFSSLKKWVIRKERVLKRSSSALTLTLSVSMHYLCFSDLWVMNVKEKLCWFAPAVSLCKADFYTKSMTSFHLYTQPLVFKVSKDIVSSLL